MLSNQGLSHGEICAMCIGEALYGDPARASCDLRPRFLWFCAGLKKIKNFSATNGDFRYYLYEALYDLGQTLSTASLTKEEAELQEMAVVQVCTLLTRNFQVQESRMGKSTYE